MEDISINHEEINYLISNCPDRYFEKPSMQTFYNKIFMLKLPAVLTGKHDSNLIHVSICIVIYVMTKLNFIIYCHLLYIV